MKYLQIVIVDLMNDGVYSIQNLYTTDVWSRKEWDEMNTSECKECCFIAMRNEHKQHFKYLMIDREEKGINAIDTVEILLCKFADDKFETRMLDDTCSLQSLIDNGYAANQLNVYDMRAMYAAVTDHCRDILNKVLKCAKPVIVGVKANTTINYLTGKTI